MNRSRVHKSIVRYLVWVFYDTRVKSALEDLYTVFISTMCAHRLHPSSSRNQDAQGTTRIEISLSQSGATVGLGISSTADVSPPMSIESNEAVVDGPSSAIPTSETRCPLDLDVSADCASVWLQSR